MNDDNADRRSLDEMRIAVGSCYSVLLDGKPSFVKIIRRMTPNAQGVDGPVKWIGERVGEVEEPEKEGSTVELEIDAFLGRTKRRDMLVQAIRLGWETDQDIYDYLQSCGVPININTVASYKSQYRSGALFKRKSKPKQVVPRISQSSEGLTPAALTLEICRLAKMVGGLKALGRTVESLQQALEGMLS